MPAKSLPWLIQEAVIARLQDISVANGYWTDAGATIYLGSTPDLGDDDPDVAIAVVRLDEQIRHQKMNVLTLLPLELQSLAKANLEDPAAATEAVLSDVKKAVELEDRTLGGLLREYMERGTTRRLERDPGSLTTGVGIAYLFPYIEGWGAS